jgi:hypothetical protein
VKQGDLRIVGVPGHLRRVRHDDAEAAAVAQEVLDLEGLAGHDDDVVIEPRAIDGGEVRVVERADVDPVNLGADLRSQASNLDHRVLLTRERRRRHRTTAGAMAARRARPSRGRTPRAWCPSVRAAIVSPTRRTP